MEGQTSVPSSVPPAGSLPIKCLAYDGRVGALYKIFIVNFLLALVTLGIYRFWGKTRMRRYLWSHTSYDGDRFEYTGTGGELFKGFLVVAVILIALTLVNTGVQYAVLVVLRGDPRTANIVTFGVSLIFYVVLFFLIFLGQYTALRYRLTRTRWRAIRGGLSGSAWRYAWMAMGYTVLRVLTLGQFTPFAAVRQWQYRIGNAYFGSAQARFIGSGREVYMPFLISFLAAVATAAIAYGGALALSPNVRDMLQNAIAVENLWGSPDNYTPAPTEKGAKASTGGSSSDAGQSAPASGTTTQLQQAAPGGAEPHMEIFRFIGLVFLLAIPVWIVALIAQCWYWTKLLALMARGTSVAGLQARAIPRTAELWWLVAGNFLISLFTLGLGHPFVLHRLWRFMSRHLEIIGTVDGAVIAQSRLAAPSRGEGLLEALDPGVF